MIGTSPEFARAEVLLQKFYDAEISVAEARELVVLWDAVPEFDAYARKNMEMESVFRFFSAVETRPLGAGTLVLEPAASPFRHLAEQVREDPSDMMLLIELAAMTPQRSEQYEKSFQRRIDDKKADKKAEEYRRLRLMVGRLLVPVLLLLGAVLLGLPLWPSGREPASASRAPAPIAVISDSASAEWEGTAPFRLGEPIHGGRLALKSGYLELLLFNGNHVVLEGPADVSLLSGNQLFCKSGRLSATVPRSGVGLEVQTPHASVVDLGTTFLLDVSAERSDVRVGDGLVQVVADGGTGAGPVKLRQGEACEVISGSAPGGGLRRMSADLSRFISLDAMQKLSEACPRNMLRRERAAAEFSLEPILRLDFADAIEPGTRRTVGDFTIERVGGEVVDERAFRAVDKADHVRVDSNVPLDSVTFATWIRLDKLDSFVFHPLLMSAGSTIGGVLWQIAPEGSLNFGFRSRKTQNVDSRLSPIVFGESRLGRRTHLALVVDRRARSVSHYVDGRVVATLPFDEKRPIRLRDTTIGNWKPKNVPIQPLNGSLEDFRIYDRALNADEVYALYGITPAPSVSVADNPALTLGAGIKINHIINQQGDIK